MSAGRTSALPVWGWLEAAEPVRWGVSPGDLARRAFGMVYLATPYTRRALRGGCYSWPSAGAAVEEAQHLQAELAFLGVCAVAPVVTAHDACLSLRLRAGREAGEALALDARHWAQWCAPLLAAARFVYVPDLPGWRSSLGVQAELREAIARNTPVLLQARPVAACGGDIGREGSAR